MPTYYRNAGSIVFHLPAPDWVRTGKALCGRDLAQPGFFVDDTVADKKTRCYCKDCLKKRSQ